MENFSGFQSVYIPLTSDIAAESYGQTVLFLSKEKTSHAKMQNEDCKWDIFPFMLEIFLNKLFHYRIMF